MTTKLTVNRFRTRKPDPVTAADQSRVIAEPPLPTQGNAEQAALREPLADDAFLTDENDDGFGDQSFVAPAPPDAPAPPYAPDAPDLPDTPAPPDAPQPVAADASSPEEIDAIRREGLTGRQLRVARRMAQKHSLPANSDLDAVRLLRLAGIDPFGQTAVLELVQGDGDKPATAAVPVPDADALKSREMIVSKGGDDRLPQTVKPIGTPSVEVRVEQAHFAEVRRIQGDIIARRRRKLALMWVKLCIFVFLPTLMAGWYYFMVATPMYAVTSKFVIQQATATSQISSLFSGTSFATGPDSVAVQGYLQSPAAMERLDADKGFRTHFANFDIDRVQRLPAKATKTQTYNLYQRYVKVSYDPTEGLINMEVSAASPQKAVEFSNALIGYAEEQIDRMSLRQRGDQEESAKASFDDAQAKLLTAQTGLVSLQEKYKTFNTDVEAGLLTSQIGALNAEVMTEKLSLAQMQANANPNQARMDPVVTRIKTLQDQILLLRSDLTQGDSSGPSIASIQSQMAMALADVTTRQMMLAQATTAMETSRIAAQRQTRYLELAVEPTPPDTPSYPRAFEDTLVVMLIFGGIYLMISMTIAILREQVSN